MLSRLGYLLFATLCCGGPILAQRSAEQAKCNDVDTPEFQRFNRDFVFALKHKDPTTLAFVVNFPLRVNTSRGTIEIDDAKSLAGHFDQIFTRETIKDILSTGNDFGCRYDMGISYGRGSAWVSNSDTAEKARGRPVIALNVINVQAETAPTIASSRLCLLLGETSHRYR